MTTIIAFFSAALFILSLILIITPDTLLDYIKEQVEVPGFRMTAVAIRIIGGVVFILAAEESRFPMVFLIIGVLALVAGFVIAALPRKTFIEMISRLANINSMLARLSGLGTLLAAWFLMYAVT
ncbi:MAG: hypothetical protein O2971_02710 [Proteobacteria bacterium]|nr:hypothetical protein [Pseudomonadota bacterium]